jgi:Right handed beta helix region/Secretion system C-terminal sorting domain
VQYRVAGSNSSFTNGYPLWFDSREVGVGTMGHRPPNEYRGSIVGLRPGTAYHILLKAGSAKNEFIVSTWSETFPEGADVKVVNARKTLIIATSGSPDGYRLYSAGPGQTATIDVRDSADNCIYINAAYIIVRGLTLKGASQDAILLGPNAHDVIIENNDITGWGAIGSGSNNQASIRIKGFSYDASHIERVIVQRNKIHHPRDKSNSWDDGGHPLGPNGINFEHAGGNHVIRYNEIYSDTAHYFMDGIGGADNFTFDGFPNANSDVYGNKVSQCYDDGLEIEGGDCNVRIWNNFTDYTFTSIACATNSIGPLYIFRNVSNVSQRSPVNASAGTIDNEDRGPFNKCGSQDSSVRGGRTYLFHNTILQPMQNGYTYPRGMGGGPVDNGGPVRNIFSRNNIWQTFRINHPAIAEYQSASNSGNSYDYDLYNGIFVVAATGIQEFHGIKGSPTYASEPPLTGPNPSGYFLASSSDGVDKGVPLNNFNEGFTGTAPDIGAYETGRPALQFGVNAGTNEPPIARTQEDFVLPLTGSTAQLRGNVSSDPDGIIVSYLWKQISGPNQAVITDAQTSVATVSDLKQGIYTFELAVTDNEGAFSTTTMKIMVGQKPSFIVYPNPASGLLNMQYVSALNGQYRISIFDSGMRLLWSEIVNKDQVFITRTIDLYGFKPGVYFNEISSVDGKQKSMARFVKM